MTIRNRSWVEVGGELERRSAEVQSKHFGNNPACTELNLFIQPLCNLHMATLVKKLSQVSRHKLSKTKTVQKQINWQHPSCCISKTRKRGKTNNDTQVEKKSMTQRLLWFGHWESAVGSWPLLPLPILPLTCTGSLPHIHSYLHNLCLLSFPQWVRID